MHTFCWKAAHFDTYFHVKQCWVILYENVQMYIFPIRVRLLFSRFANLGLWLVLLFAVSMLKTLIKRTGRHQNGQTGLTYPYFTTCSTASKKWRSLHYLQLPSDKRDTCKQCRSRSDAAESGVWSGSTLFALRSESRTKHDINLPDTPYIRNEPVQKVEVSTWHKWVKVHIS